MHMAEILACLPRFCRDSAEIGPTCACKVSSPGATLSEEEVVVAD